MLKKAAVPFRFVTRLSLPFATGLKARTLTELLAGLNTVADPVIYYHTHRFLQEHHFLTPEPPNDFAYWVGRMLGDERLGERLAAIDTVRYASLGELRDALAAALESGLKKGDDGRIAPDGKEFYFMRSVRFSLPTAREAGDLKEFTEQLRKVSPASLYLHAFEARLRPPFGVNDMSFWLSERLGESDLAKKIAALDPYTQTLEGLRRKILDFLDKRLHAAA